MANDRRTYRFVKDSRVGRVVLAESSDMQSMAGSVAEYVAEKVLERERTFEGEWISLKNETVFDSDNDEEVPEKFEIQQPDTMPQYPNRGFGQLLMAVVLGSGITIAALVAAAFFFVPKVF